jgi:4-hydroxy-2-oxoglutarate aldolase
MKLHGIFPPVTTPFAADGTLALDKLRSNIERYNRMRLAGYVVLGSTGEAILLTWAESERVLATVREAAAANKVLIAGTGTESTEETIQRTNRAAEMGYNVALVRTPHYYKPAMTPEVLAEYYRRVADRAKMPILVYAVPQFTGVNVDAALIARLTDHPNIIGIKESSGDVRRAAEIIDATPSTFQTLVGSAPTLYGSLSAGAVGAILGVACPLPEACVELYETFATGDTERAQSLQQRLLGPSKLIVNELGVAGVKYAMDQRGLYGGAPRPPLLPLNEANRRRVDQALGELAGTAAAASRP